MEFIKTAFTKIRDYFTANTGRKIFFFGIIATTLIFLLYGVFRFEFLYVIAMLTLAVTGSGTLWDSM